jgi:hypothetical protein
MSPHAAVRLTTWAKIVDVGGSGVGVGTDASRRKAPAEGTARENRDTGAMLLQYRLLREPIPAEDYVSFVATE